jgi:DNA-binding response OmpR family regulator
MLAPLLFTERYSKETHVSSHPVPRVFVVDDEHVIAATLATILHMNGFSARFFTNPVEALAAARLDAPDLLVSDVSMPGLSGVDLAIQIKAQYPECKILLFSRQAATLDLLKDARAHGHNFQMLQNPVHPSVMLARVGEQSRRFQEVTKIRPLRNWLKPRPADSREAAHTEQVGAGHRPSCGGGSKGPSHLQT